MHRSKHQPPRAAGKRTAISLAALAVLTTAVPVVAQAQQTTISGTYTSTQPWFGGDLLVDSSAVIQAANGSGLFLLNPALGTLTNNGTISGTVGIQIPGPNIVQAIINNNLINGGQSYGLFNADMLGTLTNNSGGTIMGGALDGVMNSGSINTLINNGLMSGAHYGLLNYYTGVIDTLVNGGTILSRGAGWAGIDNARTITSLTNNSGGLIGTFNTGTGLVNTGSIGTLSNSGTIMGGANPAISNTGLSNTGTIDALINVGTLNGATVTGGTITGGNTGINNAAGLIGTLSNTGLITGQVGIGIKNDATITRFDNGGMVSGGNTGLANASGLITTLVNSGTINGTSDAGINNGGTITSLTNAVGGDIHSAGLGVFNAGRIDTLVNSGTIAGGVNAGISNGGTVSTITSLTNNVGAVIRSSATGVYNSSTIGTLSNSGTISGVTVAGVANDGSIGTLTNRGVIRSDSGWGIYNTGTISALANTGTITGSIYAINNVDPASSLGVVTNSGVIAGDILQASSGDLTINGGTGAAFGTLTGFGGTIGTLTNTASNVVFGTGNQMLNDNIDVGSHSVMNTAGVLQVNNAIRITGNYSQAAAATLQIGVSNGAVAGGSLASDSGYGRLVVSGSAIVDAGSAIALQKLSSYAFAAGQRFVVIDAASSGTNYHAGSLNYSASGFSGTVTGTTVASGGRSDLVVTLVSGAAATTPGTPPGTTPGSGSTGGGTSPTSPTTQPQTQATMPNAVSSLNGLANYSGLSPELLNLFNASKALSLGSVAEANRAGAQLGPASQAAGTRGAMASALDVLNAISDRVNGQRSVQTGVPTGDDMPAYGAWGQALGGHVSQGARDQVDGYRANYGGLLFGADTALGEHWRAGGAFSYTNASLRNTGDTDGDSMRVNAYGLIGYATYSGTPWYVNLAAGAVQQDYDTSRALNFSGFSGQAKGEFTGKQYVARAEAGYPLAAGAYTVTPLAGLTYSHVRQNGYTETGGSGGALSVGDTHLTSVTSDFGAKIERAFTTAYGTVVPYLQLTWRHEYGNAQQRIHASFAADPTGETGFTTVGASPAADMGVLSAVVTLLRANNLSLTARYTLQAAPHFVSHTGGVRLKLAF